MNTNTSSKVKTIPTYGKQDLDQSMSNFRLLVLNNSNDILKVKENLINSGKMSHSEKEYIRAFSWRIFLGTISIDEKTSLKSMIEETINKRKTVKNLIKKNTVNKLKGDPLGGLSVEGEGDKDAEGWDSFFNQSEVANLINFDVERTMPGEKIFQEPYIREMENTILKLFAKNHKKVSYKQGMNEILSLLIYAIYPYYVKSPVSKYTNEIIDKWVKDPIGNYKEIYHFFHDENELQNDIYYLFGNIMIKFGLSKIYDDEQKEGKAAPYFIRRANTIILRKLGQVDKQMYLHLINKNLDYRMIFQRWLKCLFKREFPNRESCLIWDTIFAHEAEKPTGEMIYIDYIVLAMLLYVKKDLLKRDDSEMFEILLKYPEISPFRNLLNLAEKIKHELSESHLQNNSQNEDKNINQISSASSKEQPIVKKEQIKIVEGSQSTKNMIQINPLLFNPLMMNPQLQNNQNMMFYPYNPMMVQQPISQPKPEPKNDDFVIITKEDLSPMERIKSSYYVSDSSSVNALKELKNLGNKYRQLMSIEDKNRLDFLIDTLSKQL